MRTIPELNIDTKMLSDRLAKAEVGEVVTYTALSGLIGRDVQNGARGNLSAAIRRQVRDGRVFACVRGSGVKRLSDKEIVGVGLEVVNRVRRAANRATAKLAAVSDFDALPPEAKVTHQVAMSVLGVLGHLAKPATIKKLEARVQETQAALPLGRTLEALSK